MPKNKGKVRLPKPTSDPGRHRIHSEHTKDIEALAFRMYLSIEDKIADRPDL